MHRDYDPNSPEHKSWIDVPAGHDFPIQNLPFGVFQTASGSPRAGIAIGEQILDLAELAASGYLGDIPELPAAVFSQSSLNSFLALGRPVWRAVRARASWLLRRESPELRDHTQHRARVLVNRNEATMRPPVEIGDYVDFYSSKEHASNVGSMFRDPSNPLLPNWKYIPVGYHGRTSSIVLSGQDIRRPKGQINPTKQTPVFAASEKLDIELEMGFVVGKSSELGTRISPAEAGDYIFGMVLVNDWSARDIQQWEYVPLGPFLGKSFATSITPWIVTLDALEPFRVAGPEQDPPPLAYLRSETHRNLDLELEVRLQPGEESQPKRICRTNFRHMYWNMEQQLAHLTSNGANLRIGDFCASGTVSGPEPDSFGSLLEITWNGAKPISFPGGGVRRFLEDGDTVIMRAGGSRNGIRVGFGELRAKVLPAFP